MNPRVAPLLIACAIASSATPTLADPTLADPTNGDPAVADYARARTLYQQAAASFEQGHYTNARELLLQAWALRKSYDVAASLGDTEVKLGLFPEAAEHLSYSLRTFPPLENEQALATVRRQLEAARKVAAAFRVSVDRPDAEVRVDGRLVGTSPLVDPIFVAPGTHTIEARRGSDTGAQTLIGEAGTEKVVSLSPTAPATHDEADSGHRSIVPLIVGGAVVAAGLTTGIAFHLSANSKDDHADGIRNRLGISGCAGTAGQSADCAALRDDIQGADRATTWSTVGFVVAGVGAVGASIWYFTSPRRSGERGVDVSAFAVPGSAVVSASGRF